MHPLLKGTLALCLVAIGCSFRGPELNTLLRDAMEDNERLHVVAIDPTLDHTTLAERISCDAEQVAVLPMKFEAEDVESLRAGQGKVLGPLRRWVGAAVGDIQAPTLFGTTQVVEE